MSKYARLSMAPTKEQHDAAVARKGRAFTQGPMRYARPIDDDSSSSGMTALDRAVADTRRGSK